MLTVELTEKELMALQLMIDSEMKDNENRIVKIREDGAKGCYLLIDSLKSRNELLARVKGRLENTKRYVEEENVWN